MHRVDEQWRIKKRAVKRVKKAWGRRCASTVVIGDRTGGIQMALIALRPRLFFFDSLTRQPTGSAKSASSFSFVK